MKFRLILLLLGWRLVWLARRNPGFRGQLENRDVIMQWRTFDGSVARWYHFRPARVESHHGLNPAPSVTLNFKDADYAFRTLQAAGKNQMAFMEGMQAGDIKVEGDPGHLMWFMTLMKFIAPGKSKR
ncbi:hypothetical protein [Alloalcanivorax mobilis]|uniref:hypothetical protein n=1 Tax=Alloalcanivorax mobilis TaxID=2019569 RepID=UPI000B5B0D1C|nr:hypothetical protein [Alloalcanivorax mobilis]ASK35750.1 hypothetical protein CEK62_15850 [Alcanivorax sp. N3-2A]|tara:strand:- start:133 stop:513 length:381 start_codon:yes stop_codon:yes gene_type:complete